MPTIDINGTPVAFPFKPYDCQLTYMRGVLEALDGSVRGLRTSLRHVCKFENVRCSGAVIFEEHNYLVPVRHKVFRRVILTQLRRLMHCHHEGECALVEITASEKTSVWFTTPITSRNITPPTAGQPFKLFSLFFKERDVGLAEDALLFSFFQRIESNNMNSCGVTIYLDCFLRRLSRVAVAVQYVHQGEFDQNELGQRAAASIYSIGMRSLDGEGFCEHTPRKFGGF